tara:strand:- start:615 stop:1127 length:513 start_codon:yes stop_codon:yes gene_type:complete
MKASQKSLKKWTKEKWGTKSGKPSAKTGERYLPKKAREALTPKEYAATSAAKRKGTAAGKQFVKQPKEIAEKTKKFRASKGGLTMKKGYHKMPDGTMMKDSDMKKKSGYMYGGMAKKKTMGYRHGGMAKPNKGMKALKKAAPAVAKRMGYRHGGMANCGASMKATQKGTK